MKKFISLLAASLLFVSSAQAAYNTPVSGPAGGDLSGTFPNPTVSKFNGSSTIPGSAISGNITGNAANVTGTVSGANGGTGATTPGAALDNLSGLSATNYPAQSILRLGTATYAAQNSYVLNADPTYMPHWRSCVAKVAAGTGNCKVLFAGDSTTNGRGSFGATVDGRPRAFSTAVSKALSGNGIASTWEPFLGFTYNDDRFATTSWFVGTGDPSIGGTGLAASSSSTTPAVFTTAAPANQFDIYWEDQGSVSNKMTVSLDGGTAVQLNGTATRTFQKTTLTAPSVGIHTLTFTWVSGFADVLGIDSYDNTISQVRAINGGWNGATSTNWNVSTYAYSPLPALGSYAPDVTFIDLGINDWTAAAVSATYTTNIQALITKAKISGDVVLVTPCPSQITSATLAQQQGYVNAMYAMAISNNIPLIDNWSRMQSWEISNPLGLYYDSLHQTAAGYADFGSSISNFLLSMAKGVSSLSPTIYAPSFSGFAGFGLAPGKAIYPIDDLGAGRFGQLIGGGNTPTIAAGSASGTSPTVSISGTNLAGVVNVTTGTSPAASATLATITYAAALTTAQKGCTLTPQNANTALATAMIYTTAPTTTAWTIGVGGTPLTASTAYVWSYTCF